MRSKRGRASQGIGGGAGQRGSSSTRGTTFKIVLDSVFYY
jgi:hypothetical protein